MVEVKKSADAGPALLVITLIVMVTAGGIGMVSGLGRASVLAAIVGLFCLLPAFVGALRPDLRRMAWLGPCALVSATVPRFLASWHYAAGVAGLVAVLFVISLLPAAGTRFRVAAIGMSFIAIGGYGVALPVGTPDLDVVWAVALGIVVALTIRIIVGIADPSGRTREQIVAPLRPGGIDTVEVIGTWVSDRPSVWTTEVLARSFGYRRVVAMVTHLAHTAPGAANCAVDRRLSVLGLQASAVADIVTARKTTDAVPVDLDLDSDGIAAVPEQMSTLLAQARTHLIAIQNCAFQRDATRVEGFGDLRRTLIGGRLASVLRPSPGVLAEALTKSVGIIVAAATGLQLAQPAFANTYLNAVVSMMQPTWAATVERVAYRLLGCIVAVVLVVATALLLPPPAMYLVALVGLFALTWFISSHPIVSNAGGVAMSVALTTTGRHTEPLDTLAQLAVMLGVASAIVIVVSVPAVIAMRRRTPASEAARAVGALVEALADIEDATPRTRLRAFVGASVASRRLRNEAYGMTSHDRDALLDLAGLIDAVVLLMLVGPVAMSTPPIKTAALRDLLIPDSAGALGSDKELVPGAADESGELGAVVEICVRQIVTTVTSLAPAEAPGDGSSSESRWERPTNGSTL
ncbi:hypothetical protein ABLE94_22610 [Gordonia sp. VNK1]|uniref:hypothetical protein n=1 Tax=Gordonia oleivorans TaxID=3156618 RepID=UPI0032B42C9F